MSGLHGGEESVHHCFSTNFLVLSKNRLYNGAISSLVKFYTVIQRIPPLTAFDKYLNFGVQHFHFNQLLYFALNEDFGPWRAK